jgi:GR25 family glycosyltransferase involved in LPS biosynthesis
MIEKNETKPIIQVINLLRRPDRLTRISGELERAGLKFEILVAVDGQLESLESEFISKGEMGCWKSHCMSMRRMVEKGNEFSLILEDDASLGQGVDEKFLSQVTSMMKRNKLDLLQIGYIEQFYTPSLRAGLLEFLLSLLSGRGTKDSSGLRFVLGDFRAGTHAYIVNSRLAKAISSTVIEPPLIPWDGFLESLARGQMGRQDIRIARLVKSVVSQTSRTSKNQEVDSDVGIQ